MNDVKLSDGELQATVAALWAYRSETQHYLRGYIAHDGTHSECCAIAQERDRRRATERDSLNQRLRDIDGAIQALDPGPLADEEGL